MASLGTVMRSDESRGSELVLASQLFVRYQISHECTEGRLDLLEFVLGDTYSY